MQRLNSIDVGRNVPVGQQPVQPDSVGIELLEPRIAEPDHLRHKAVEAHAALQKLPKLLLPALVVLHFKADDSVAHQAFEARPVMRVERTLVEGLGETIDFTGGGEVENIREKIAAIQGRRERFEEHRDALAASGEDQLSLTDPDSRAMHAATRVGVGYNIQIAVDAKHKLIAEQQVHSKVSDLGLLAETAVAARRNLAVDRIDAVADAGYFKIEDIEACENAGVMPHVPKPQRGSTVSQGLFPKERFRYDGGEDIYICPDGQRLALHSKRKRRDLIFASYANRAACKECQLKSKCTKSAFRRVLRYVDEAILERMAERLAARPELLDARRESVEHPFGSIKQWMGQGAFLTRRLENVRGEFSITALAYNIRRAISLVGVPALIAAARA